MADEALPTEAGKARVTISVNGSIVLTKSGLARAYCAVQPPSSDQAWPRTLSGGV